MHFRSINQLTDDVRANIWRIPPDVDLVLAIPRSGFLVASMIALAKNLPFTDLDGFLSDHCFISGKTRGQKQADIRKLKHILVVDDSCRTGASMLEARAKLESQSPLHFTTCVAYGVTGENPGVDLVFERVPEPRVFEWNFLHHPFVERACFDIDGVLCVDPQEKDNDDGDAYLSFLAKAKPLHVTNRKIGTLVTSRLEKYRQPTEAWLKANGIEYGELRMLDCPDAETRRRLGLHASFKAEMYSSVDSPIFVESELRQAQEIANLSGKPVISIEQMVLCKPGMTSFAAIKRQSAPKRILRNLDTAILSGRGKLAFKQFTHLWTP